MKRMIQYAAILPAIKVLHEDEERYFALMRSDPSQCTQRTWIRAHFAWVEAVCFYLRRATLETKFKKDSIRRKDVAEFLALNEIKYAVSKKGEALEESANTKTVDYVIFSLLYYGRAFGIELLIERGSEMGQSLVGAFDVRNRITHPKDLQDVAISASDIEVVKRFDNWFRPLIHSLLNDQARKRLRKEAGIAKRTRKERTFLVEEAKYKRG